MTIHKVKDPSRFMVARKRCDACPFSKNQTIVTPRRLHAIKNTLRRTNRPFVCHKAMARDLVCRGFYDTEANLVVTLAHMLEIVEFVEL